MNVAASGEMTKHSLYAYALGLNFGAIAVDVTEDVQKFIESRSWICPEVWPVNQQRTSEDWELGLNLALPDSSCEPAGWYADVEAVVAFCCQLRREYHRDFVIGIADNRTGCGEDIIEVSSDKPDLEYLRRFIGTAPPMPKSGEANR
jgi:hypothetical protein